MRVRRSLGSLFSFVSFDEYVISGAEQENAVRRRIALAKEGRELRK